MDISFFYPTYVHHLVNVDRNRVAQILRAQRKLRNDIQRTVFGYNVYSTNYQMEWV